jgi:VWFA-related protein
MPVVAHGKHGAVAAAMSLIVVFACAWTRAQEPRPVFRSATSLVSVDVIVRDSSGNVVRGLTAADFTITEDGRPQPIQAFTFQQITDAPPPGPETPDLLTDLEARVREDLERAPGVAREANAVAAATPASTFAGRRLLVLLFDVSSMEPEDVQRAVESADQYVDRQMTPADLVAVVTVGSTIEVLTDFTSARGDVRAALSTLAATEGTSTPPPAASTVETDEAAATTAAGTSDDTGFDTFNNDVRLRALKMLADTLSPIEQKKAVLYFSGGMTRDGDDNQVELRAAINAAVRGNVAIYPIDSRGLQALAPGGAASQASRGGVALFSGQAVQRQFAQLAASQDTLTTLAADTGGRAFTDSNEFGDAFARAQRDLAAYYLIGYSSGSTTKDGRFRRIQVTVKRPGLRVEARAGYYAERDFVHTSRGDREAQLGEQLAAAVSSTDLPLVIGAGWFRQTDDRFYVPITLAVPGSALPAPAPGARITLDVRGVVRDEQGRSVGRIKDTIELPAGQGGTLAGRQVVYQSGLALPPGRFSVKVVVRENASGTIGSFESPIAVPQLREAGMKVSAVVLGTQFQPTERTNDNPLVRDGVRLLPNLTRIVGRNQNVYFYYEVYDPGLAEAAPDLRTSLAFYRDNVKVYETPVVERTMMDDPARRAVLFQLEVPGSAFTPGTYTCQINIIDAVAGRVAFPRLTFQVR